MIKECNPLWETAISFLLTNEKVVFQIINIYFNYRHFKDERVINYVYGKMGQIKLLTDKI